MKKFYLSIVLTTIACFSFAQEPRIKVNEVRRVEETLSSDAMRAEKYLRRILKRPQALLPGICRCRVAINAGTKKLPAGIFNDTRATDQR